MLPERSASGEFARVRVHNDAAGGGFVAVENVKKRYGEAGGRSVRPRGKVAPSPSPA